MRVARERVLTHTPDAVVMAAAREHQTQNAEGDPPEKRKRPADLLPLPTINDKNFPQEDKRYFDRKSYVRKDKNLPTSISSLQRLQRKGS